MHASVDLYADPDIYARKIRNMELAMWSGRSIMTVHHACTRCTYVRMYTRMLPHAVYMDRADDDAIRTSYALQFWRHSNCVRDKIRSRTHVR